MCSNSAKFRQMSGRLFARKCFDSMRPNVVLFGENLSPDNIFKAREAAGKCDICFVVGTSANVYPANELPGLAKQNGALIVEINPENTLVTSICDISIRGTASEILPRIFGGTTGGLDTISILCESREDDLPEEDKLETMDLAERMEYLREIAIAEPNNPVAQYNLAIAYAEDGTPEEAITAYLKAIDLEPQYSPAHYNLGSCWGALPMRSILLMPQF
ncbi:MAG: Sir2 family NAD-dependent protein deacetylase [Pyrinomonadaceae bacterium]